MTDLVIVEVLPEGDDRAWITLNDGMTRLVGFQTLMAQPTHQNLRLRRLIRCPRVSPTGTHVVWPGGLLVDVHSIQQAPHGPLPLELHALVSAAQRYRPLAALLRTCDPPVPDYLDVRPVHVVASRLALKAGEMDIILAGHHPAEPEQVVSRLSDLALLLSGLVPQGMVGSLLRRSWPYARRRSPRNPSLDTALECLCAGRTDLVEAPLLHLLLPPARLAALE
jgi:hypothetical protein